MAEGKEGKHDTPQVPPENPKDVMVREWARELLEVGREPEQVVGEFIAGELK